MRLLFVNSFFPPMVGGGAELTLERIVRGTSERGHVVGVLSTHGADPWSFRDNGYFDDFRYRPRNIFLNFGPNSHNNVEKLIYHVIEQYSGQGKVATARAIDHFNPDVLICHNLNGISSDAWIAGFDAGIPVIQVLHDLYTVCTSTNMYRDGKTCLSQCPKCRILRSRVKERSKKVSAVVGVSSFVLSRVLSLGLFPGVESTVIYNSISVDTARRPSPRPSERLLRFGFLGSIVPAKGLHWLLSEFERTMSSMSRATLAVGGDYKSLYGRGLVSRYSSERISFLGYVSGTDFLKNVDVLIVPSLWPDTLPGVAIESILSGATVIGTRLGGLPEILSRSENGIIVDPEIPHSLGAAMYSLYTKYDAGIPLRHSPSILFRRTFGDVDRMVSDYIGLYKSLLPSAELPKTGPKG